MYTYLPDRPTCTMSRTQTGGHTELAVRSENAVSQLHINTNYVFTYTRLHWDDVSPKYRTAGSSCANTNAHTHVHTYVSVHAHIYTYAQTHARALCHTLRRWTRTHARTRT